MTDREAFLRFSRENPERFWDELMREMRVEWFEPYHQVLDASRGPEWAQWFTGGRLNIAHNCLDRWADTGRVACIWEGENGATRTVTFREVRDEANRVANGLRALGLEPGDRVALCLPMVPEILSILYGCFKAGLDRGADLRRLRRRRHRHAPRGFRRARALHRRLPGAARQANPAGRQNAAVHRPYHRVADALLARFPPGATADSPTLSLDSEARAFILYTSGTTGKPKGTVHTHAGCLAQMGKEIWLGFDHRDDDRFFWLSDIGWMMGPWTILGNHLFGGTIFLYDGAPDYPGPARLWETIDRHRITTFGVSPTAIRMLSNPRATCRPWIRCASSAPPANPGMRRPGSGSSSA